MHSATLGYRYARDLRAVKDMLGHLDPETTARYARVVDRARTNPARCWSNSKGDQCRSSDLGERAMESRSLSSTTRYPWSRTLVSSFVFQSPEPTLRSN
jgi:hypothetical protein